MLDWHSMDIEQVVKELNTDLHKGLTEYEARRRLTQDGHNELKKTASDRQSRRQVIFIDTIREFFRSNLERVKQVGWRDVL